MQVKYFMFESNTNRGAILTSEHYTAVAAGGKASLWDPES